MTNIVTLAGRSNFFKSVLTSFFMISLAVSSSILFSPPLVVHASVTSSAPVLGGWGGARLVDTGQNLTAPASLVFSSEKQSNFEQIALRQVQLGYNAIRASFAPYCSVLYGLNHAVPQDFMGNYSAIQLARSITVAQYFNLWIVVDYHGYADFVNSTLVDCWLNFWFGPNSTLSGPTGVVGAFMNSYDRIVWEPLNEPSSLSFPLSNTTWCVHNRAECDDNETAYMSMQYQSWLNRDRDMGDTHWVVVQNMCSFTCNKDRDQYFLDYPTVNDTEHHVFASFHTYMNYGLAILAPDGSAHSAYWNDTTADIFARDDYLTMVNETVNTRFGWPILNTEGGTSCGTVNGTTCVRSTLAIVKGAAGYTAVSLHYIQELVNYEDKNSPRFGSLLWPAAPWTSTVGAGVYGSIGLGEWGNLITFESFESGNHVAFLNHMTQPFVYPWDGNGFYAKGRHWIFYLNWTSCGAISANCLYYATSTNGAAWTTYNLGVVSANTPSVITNGTHVFYARYDGSYETLGRAMMFRVGTLDSNGTIAWEPETTVKAPTTGLEWSGMSMRLSTTGEVFIAYVSSCCDADGAIGLPYVIHSDGLNYSAWEEDTPLRGVSDDWRFSLVALSAGQMYVLFWPFLGHLRGRLYGSGVWGSEEVVNPDDTYVFENAFGFGNGNNTVYAVWQDYGTGNVQFAVRTGSWSAPETIATFGNSTNPVWTASYDSFRGEWYVLHYDYASNQILQYSGTPGDWRESSLCTVPDGDSALLIGSYYNTGQINNSTSALGVYWVEANNPVANLQLMFRDEYIT